MQLHIIGHSTASQMTLLAWQLEYQGHLEYARPLSSLLFGGSDSCWVLAFLGAGAGRSEGSAAAVDIMEVAASKVPRCGQECAGAT